MKQPFDDADKIIFYGRHSYYWLLPEYRRIGQHLYSEASSGLPCWLYPLGGALMGWRLPVDVVYEIVALEGLIEREIEWLKLFLPMKTFPVEPAISTLVSNLTIGDYGVCYVPSNIGEKHA